MRDQMAIAAPLLIVAAETGWITPAAPETAQIASGQFKGRRMTPAVASAEMIQVITWGDIIESPGRAGYEITTACHCDWGRAE